ncbi:hypothetical protein Q0F98_08755 [Paenibacillus amylolyticus]|nr:hypothetical protein Q0F98_08755 [Paenibacillus amylolyticus]
MEDAERSDSTGWRLKPPHPVAGCSDPWLYTGVFTPGAEPSHADIVRTDIVFDDGAQGVYWRVDLPDTHVRPYLENTHYGKWNYPLGVTLLGLLQTGQELGRDDYIQYVQQHIELSTSFDRYGLWDRRGTVPQESIINCLRLTVWMIAVRLGLRCLLRWSWAIFVGEEIPGSDCRLHYG